MSRDFAKELEGFERLWQRIGKERPTLPDNIRLMPGREKNPRSPAFRKGRP